MDWPGLIKAGLFRLRLTPAQFWTLTPAELQVMLGISKAVMPLDRDRLHSLIETFPDVLEDTHDGWHRQDRRFGDGSGRAGRGA
ncbi:MAG: rcc01693 family protein [Pseudomonadota bacterium]